MAQAKPAFDYQAFQQALAQFTEDLLEHTWSFQTSSYFQLMEAQSAESELFKRALLLGIQGVDAFNYRRIETLKEIRDTEYERGRKAQEERMQSSVDYYKNKLEETRAMYMKPIDFFNEKLEKHDWYYEFSDDITVYRRGKKAEAELEEAAKEGGPEFVAALSAARQRRRDNIAKH